MSLKVNAKAKSIVTIGYNRNNLFHFHIQIYSMKFELRASRSIYFYENIDKVYKFKRVNFINDFFQLNDTRIILFFNEMPTPCVEYYDMSLEKIDKQPIEALSSFSFDYRFVDASNDYLLFTTNREILLFNMNTKTSIAVKDPFELHIIDATISNDSSFLFTLSRKYMTILSCHDQKVLFRYLTEHILSNFFDFSPNKFRIRCKFSLCDRYLLFHHPCLSFIASINMR
jgi:hypothetical protein